MTLPDTTAPDDVLAPTLAQRVAGSAANFAVRRVVLLLLSGVSAAVITRLLGPSDYGQYAAAIATWSLLGAAADFGFSLMLSRDLASADPADHRPMIRAAYQVMTVWSVALVAVQVAIALIAGAGTDRGLSLLVLAPALACSGLVVARVPYMVQYRTGPLVMIDLVATILVVVGQVAAAALDFGAVGVAIAASVGGALNNIAVAVYAERLLGDDRPRTYPRWELIRRSLPLGLISIMTKVYLTIDLVLLAWLVSGPSLGNYAAASKMLTMLASVTALVMNAALPAFASQATDEAALGALVARVWHWLTVTALPIFLITVLFAPLVIHITAGKGYDPAIPLLRILTLAGVISVLSNFFGVLMIATHRTASLFVQNAAAITVNVAGNLLLVPRVGVSAAAWVTAATEGLVCVGAAVVLVRQIDFRLCAPVSVRPVIALAITAVVGIVLSPWPVVGLPLTAVTFVVAVSALRGWPEEFVAKMRFLDPWRRLARS